MCVCGGGGGGGHTHDSYSYCSRKVQGGLKEAALFLRFSSFASTMKFRHQAG